MNMSRYRYSIVAATLFSSALSAQSELTRSNRVPAPDAGHRFTPAQLVEIESRDQLARAIATNVETDAANYRDAQWKVRLMSSLLNVSSANLRNIGMQAHTLEQAHTLAADALDSQRAQPAGLAKALTDIGADLVFTPKTPCRFIDTRNVGGVIPKGASAFKVFDTYHIGPTYGGDGGCTLPGNGEIAIAANITVTVDSGAAGFLGIRPLGSTTRSSLINWPTGGTPGVANAAIITTAQDATTHHYEFEAYAGGNTPNLIVDYFGYFAPTAPTALECVSVETEVSLPQGQNDFVGTDGCQTGYTKVSATCRVEAGGALPSTVLLGTGLNGDPYCSFYNPQSFTEHGTIGSRCCRVP